MPRERRQDMDVRSARAHGAGTERGNPTQEGLTRSRHFWLLLVLFKSNSPKAKQSAPRQTHLIQASEATTQTSKSKYWHSDIFSPLPMLDRFLQYLHYSASGVKVLVNAQVKNRWIALS